MQYPVLHAITTIAPYRLAYALANAQPVVRMRDLLQGGEAVVFEFIRTIASQLATAIAHEMHGPLLIDGAAKNHALKVIDQHPQDPLTVDGVPARQRLPGLDGVKAGS